MQPPVHLVFLSDDYRIVNYQCQCLDCNTSKKEYNEHLSVSFIRTGNFYYHTFRKQLDSYNGSVLISKPGYEYRVSHPAGIQDECTILLFTEGFWQQLLDQAPVHAGWFFQNKDLQSVLLKTGPETDFLHHLLLQAAGKPVPCQLEVDGLVMELLQQVLACLNADQAAEGLADKLKRHHLSTIEEAKAYMCDRFNQELSLKDLATHCHVSPFHFSRLFKTFTGYSPYQYLQDLRLKQAELLLKTGLPVADVAFSSGFNSLEYFSSAFKKKYRMAPSRYRNAC